MARAPSKGPGRATYSVRGPPIHLAAQAMLGPPLTPPGALPTVLPTDPGRAQSAWPWGVHMSKNQPFIHQEERKGDATLTFLPQPESASWLHINQAGKYSHFPA